MDAQPSDFSAALARAMQREQLALKQVQRRMADLGAPVSMATLSYWRSGQRQPEGPRSAKAVAVLESVLSMSPGALSDLLGSPRRRAPEAEMPFDVQIGAAQIAEDARHAFDLRGRDPLSPRSQHLTVEVDGDRWVTRTTMRSTWRARVGRVRRTPIYLKTDDPLDHPPDVEAGAGCSIGARHYDPEIGLLTAELLLPHEVDRGETVMTEHAFVGRMSAERERHFELFVTRRYLEAGLRIQFDTSRQPAHCTLHVTDRNSEMHRPLSIVAGSVSHVIEDFGPGSLNISWEWPD